VFVITTDGVLEVENEAGEEFSTARLAVVMKQSAGWGPEQTADAVVTAVRSFGKQKDDQTILVVRVL
jgi:serine phosphatase RsbU (regulator of sigma subunit)